MCTNALYEKENSFLLNILSNAWEMINVDSFHCGTKQQQRQQQEYVV